MAAFGLGRLGNELPDLLVVCDPGKIDEKGVRGAPDLVAEILSPTTRSRDMVAKLALYEKHGVRECWIVDPESSRVTAHRLGPDGRCCRRGWWAGARCWTRRCCPASHCPLTASLADEPAVPPDLTRLFVRHPPGA
jgi:hypothetical protein